MDDLTRDPELAALLRGAAGDTPDVDWDALRARVHARAELPLARLRQAPAAPRVSPWRLRALVPLAAAAALGALAFGLRPETEPRLDARDRQVVQEIVDASLPENLDAVISGEAAQVALLEAAVGS